MISKILSFLMLFTLNATISYGADDVDEPLRLTEKGIIETWVHPALLAQSDFVVKIQEMERQQIAADHVPGTRFTHSPVEIELAFLRHVRELSEAGKKPVTLQISGELRGFVYQGTPFAFGTKGTHYVSLRNSDGLDAGRARCVRFITGDCFETLGRLVDALYVDCFENYLNPTQHRTFLELLQRLLRPGGKAFFVSFSFASNDLYEHTKKRMKVPDDLYPGFVEHTTSALETDVSGMKIHSTSAKTEDIRRPFDDEEISVELCRKEKLTNDQARLTLLQMLSRQEIDADTVSFIFSKVSPKWRPDPEEIAKLFEEMTKHPELKIDLMRLMTMGLHYHESQESGGTALLQKEMESNPHYSVLPILAHYATPNSGPLNPASIKMNARLAVINQLQQGEIKPEDVMQKLSGLWSTPEDEKDLPQIPVDQAREKLIDQVRLIVLEKLHQKQITLRQAQLIFASLRSEVENSLQVNRVKTKLLENIFSPGIYRRIFRGQTGLTLSDADTFYIGANGKGADGPWDESKVFTAAIVQKTSEAEVTVVRHTLMERLYEHRGPLALLAVGTVGVLWQMYGND